MGLFDFLKKKQPQTDRYAGKPLLKILEAFVLDAIGELEPSQLTVLEKMTPKLQQIYNSTSSWQDIVIEVMHWNPEIQPAIRALWEKNQVVARSTGRTLSPAEFAVMFVDENVDHN
jgi:hypothetical protein